MPATARDEKKAAPPDLDPVAVQFDWVNRRVTISQRGQFEIRAREITITLDSLELMWYQLHTAALSSRGLLGQVTRPSVVPPPSSGDPS